MEKLWPMLEQYAESFWTAGEEACHIMEVLIGIGLSAITILFILGLTAAITIYIWDRIRDKLA